MEIRSLLRGEEGLQDDRLLETDMMRFLAIIGIVFWIIFALIKSIPFQMPESDSPLAQPIVEKQPVPVSPQTNVSPEAKNHSHPLSVQMGKKADPTPSEPAMRDTKQTKSAKPAPPRQQGVRMQFQSLDDLLDLMTTRKVRLFCRARATGFDLFFEGNPQDNAVSFRAVKGLPSRLWEIKSGKDHAYFLDLMASTYPAIRSFPIRQVLVAFADEELEKLVEHTLVRLEGDGDNGILSITRNSDTVFEPYNVRRKND